MKCVICRRGTVEAATVEAEVKVGDDRILVRLEAERCQQCGEAYYSGADLRRLEAVRKRFGRKGDVAESVGRVYRLSTPPEA